MRPRHRPFRALLACCILLSALASLPWIAPPSVAAGTAYTIVDLGTLRPNNSGQSRANGINKGGQVVGVADYAANADSHAFLREPNGTMRDLGTGQPQNQGFALASAVNSAGMVAGISQNLPEREHATVWRRNDNGTYSAYLLDSLTGNDFSGAGARDINDSGWVVGSGEAPRSSAHGALWQIAEDGTITTLDLGTLRNVDGAISFASAINNAGTIVGNADTTQGYTATRWVVDANGNPSILDLGRVIENSSSSANDISDLGLIVGQQTTQGSLSTHATLWRVEGENEVSYRQLPDLLSSDFVVSTAEAINNHGLIVGKSSSVLRPADFYETTHAVAWRIGPGDTASIIDLNSLIPSTLGWELVTQANDINDAGQIVAWLLLQRRRSWLPPQSGRGQHARAHCAQLRDRQARRARVRHGRGHTDASARPLCHWHGGNADGAAEGERNLHRLGRRWHLPRLGNHAPADHRGRSRGAGQLRPAHELHRCAPG
ncbi:MAG: DUF3466 family protein [Chloroflexia bacterium]